MRSRALIAAVIAAGCGPKSTPTTTGPDLEAREKHERWYRLSWHGSPVGWAVERERDDRIERIEHLEVLRGAALVITDLEVQIDVGPDLAPTELRIVRREAGVETTARAVHAADGWRRMPGSNPVFAPADAVPSELVPAHVRVRGGFSAPVILSGWDLAVGDGVVIPTGERRLAARTVVGDRAIDAAVELDMHGNTERIVDSSGTVAMRMDRASATRAFEPVDVIAAGSIDLADAEIPIEVTLAAHGTPAPPAVPGQTVRIERDTWHVTLDPVLPGSLPLGLVSTPFDQDIDEIAAAVGEAISPSLAGNTASAGDCTAYAVAFAAYAKIAGIPTQVVTGFLVDGNRLIRHRWNVAWTGTRWTTVDASQPAALAPRLGVALSDDSIPGLTAAAMFDVSAAP